MPEYRFIPKEEKIVPRRRSSNISYLFSLLVFIITVSAAGGLYLYKSYLQKQIDVYISSLEKAKLKIEPASINEIINFSNRIESAKKILADHHRTISLFELLESEVLKSNYFNNFSLINEESKTQGGIFSASITLNGAARSYEELTKQMTIFNSNPNFSNVAFSSFNLLDNGYVSYNVKLGVNESLFKK